MTATATYDGRELGRIRKGEHAGRFLLTSSRVKTVLACRQKADFQYIQKVPTKPGLPQMRGTLFHLALERTRYASRDADGASLATHVAGAWLEGAPPSWAQQFLMQHLELAEQMAEPLEELRRYAATIKADALAGKRKGGAQEPTMTTDYKRRKRELLGPWQDILDGLYEAERILLDSEESPWELTKRSALEQFEESLASARDYMAWWDALGADQPDVLEVEKRFDCASFDADFLISGQMDCIAFDPVLQAIVVDDAKGGSGWEKADRAVQAMFCVVGSQEVLGVRPEYVRFLNYDQGCTRDVYKVALSWDWELLELCRTAKRLYEGRAFRTYHGCGVCSYADRCLTSAGLAGLPEDEVSA